MWPIGSNTSQTAPVLWVKQMMMQSKKDLLAKGETDEFMRDLEGGYWEGESRKIVDYLLEMETRGLPVTTETFGYADSLVDLFLDEGDLTQNQRKRLTKIQSKIKQALKYFRPNGLFCVFSGPEDKISPQLIRN